VTDIEEHNEGPEPEDALVMEKAAQSWRAAPSKGLGERLEDAVGVVYDQKCHHCGNQLKVDWGHFMKRAYQDKDEQASVIQGAIRGRKVRASEGDGEDSVFEVPDKLKRNWSEEATAVFKAIANLKKGNANTITKEELMIAQGPYILFDNMDTQAADGEVSLEEFLSYLCNNEEDGEKKKEGRGTAWVTQLLYTLQKNLPEGAIKIAPPADEIVNAASNLKAELRELNERLLNKQEALLNLPRDQRKKEKEDIVKIESDIEAKRSKFSEITQNTGDVGPAEERDKKATVIQAFFRGNEVRRDYDTVPKCFSAWRPSLNRPISTLSLVLGSEPSTRNF